ncbi:FAD/NAD(P)-binding oxidoreductase [Nonomuraea jabiensis]|uniref:NAD(P)/FAD-dependent oxidoreductase n=1 Tax=Nonomuraea jabiensis TaxID=882448 RepID=UPI00341DE918
MTLSATLAELVRDFRANGRIVIVGASLAGLRGAEALRAGGFSGSLTIIGDEPYEPYDRPPLSKQVLKGWVPADHTLLPRARELDARWRLGVAATGLDRAAKQVHLANGEQVPYDRLLIATGTRARQWPNPAEAALEGVLSLRTRDDAARLQQALAARPSRVLVIGGGFIGSEVASVCRELDIPVTLTERGPAPLVGALGGVIGEIAAEMQRDHGVDLRCGVSVSSLEGDAAGHVRRARLSDGTTVEADVVLAALGSIRNVEWLQGSGLAAGFWGGRVRRRRPGVRHQRRGDRQRLRGGRRGARATRVVRVPVPRDGALGQRRPRRRGGGPQHGQPRTALPSASAAARLLVRPVRRQHQVRRRAAVR